MTDDFPKDEPGAQERFEDAVAVGLTLPPMTHAELVERLKRQRAEKKKRRGSKPAPKSS